MEEPAVVLQEKGGSWELAQGGGGGGERGAKEHASLASLLKHSCLLCWSSSPRDKDDNGLEMDERVIGKTAEIRVRRPQHLPLVCASGCARVREGKGGDVYVCARRKEEEGVRVREGEKRRKRKVCVCARRRGRKERRRERRERKTREKESETARERGKEREEKR
ncbi:hypothetical protein WMY93_001011 [Mugilogobius chulae]|uniref:Uncharacterized protein n=1 Tax=Mugilogobius chulae TaxID=88201 RepID=A0AAW0Q2K4_9GOBI